MGLGLGLGVGVGGGVEARVGVRGWRGEVRQRGMADVPVQDSQEPRSVGGALVSRHAQGQQLKEGLRTDGLVRGEG